MVTWLLLGTVLYLLTAYTPSLFLIAGIGFGNYLGSRDEEPITNTIHARAERAARNFRENYPVFMGLGILALVVPEANLPMATTGAMVFVVARLAYLPLYMAAVPVVRSAVFMVGWMGLIAMGLSILPSG